MANILVTGVGGGVGQGIIKSLQGSPHTVIGADGELLGTGLYAAARAYTVPYAARPEYIDRIVEVCRKESCALVFPGMDAELIVLSRAAARIKSKAGATVVASPPPVVDICDDKLLTAQFLSRHGFPAPRTFPFTAEAARELGFPHVIKPMRAGARSRGVHLIRDARELDFRLATVDAKNYVAQEFLDGEEYTCGSVTFDGRCHGIIVMRRILRDGDTYKAFVSDNPAIHRHVREVAEALKPFGPCNFQLRLVKGVPHMFEFNARCSGTTYSRTLAGFNEPLMTIEHLLDGRTPAYSIREVSILRYWNELVVDNARISDLEAHGRIEGNGSRL
jgi:carbamoyl-phosphate synthase large subunit